jgi:hypothetical protein
MSDKRDVDILQPRMRIHKHNDASTESQPEGSGATTLHETGAYCLCVCATLRPQKRYAATHVIALRSPSVDGMLPESWLSFTYNRLQDTASAVALPLRPTSRPPRISAHCKASINLKPLKLLCIATATVRHRLLPFTATAQCHSHSDTLASQRHTAILTDIETHRLARLQTATHTATYTATHTNTCTDALPR